MGRIVRGLMANDTVKLMAITGKDICETARELHGLSRVCTAALGRSLLITDMMGAQGRKRQAHHHNQRRRPGWQHSLHRG